MSEHFDRALDRLADDQSPREELTHLDEQELRMVRMAQLLRGMEPAPIDTDFRTRLREEIVAPLGSGRVSRRTAFLSGLGAMAAGIVGGLGVDRLLGSRGGGRNTALVGDHGSWFSVAQAADLPDGAVRPFTAGAVQGVLVRQGSKIHAVSRICSHMGCGLGYRAAERRLVCPCHGAQFALDGRSIAGPGGYSAPLPPLSPIRVRTNGTHIEVWAVAETVPSHSGGTNAGWT